MTAAQAPQREIGYAAEAGPNSYNWWMNDGETTPELRWPQSVTVYNRMRTEDAQIKSVLAAVTFPVRRTPWRIDPNGAREEVVRLVADDLGLPVVGESKPQMPVRTRDRFSWADHVRLALLMLPFGHMFFEQVYRVSEDGSRAHLRKLGERLPSTINEIQVARDGGLVSITQTGSALEADYGNQKPIPVNRLVAYVLDKEGGNWLGRSILRPAYKNWLLKDRLLRVQAQTVERNGMGVPTYTGAENESDLSKGKALATSLRAGETSGAAIPNGATLALLGVTGTLPDADTPIRYHDEQIARAVLAHFLNLGTQTGSWALGTTFADFFTLSLQTLADQIADTATQHVVEDLVDINWGPEEPAPRIVHDEIGSRQQATAQAIKVLVDAGILEPDEVLEESTRQQYGLPPKDPATTRGGDESADAGLGGGLGEFMFPPTVAASAGGVGPKDGGGEDDDDLLDVGSPYDDLDDEDEGAAALAQAIAELAGEADDVVVDDGADPVTAALSGPALANFNALHPRGHHGKFRTTVDKLRHQLLQWMAAGNDPTKPATWTSDPFHGFSREQLRKAAGTRGMALPRGASRDYIAHLLAADLSQAARQARTPSAPGAGVPNAPAAPVAPVRPPWPTTLDGQVMNDLQAWVNAGAPRNIDPLKHYSSTQLDIAARHLGLPGGAGSRTVQLKQHARATLTPGDLVAEQPIHPNRVGGVTGVTVRPIPPGTRFGGGQLRQSQEVYVNGTKIGQIDAYGTRVWGVTAVSGSSVGLGSSTRLGAVQSLVAHHQAYQSRAALNAALSTNVPGVTLSHLSGNGTPGSPFHLDVQFAGNYVGHVEDSQNGLWSANVPVRASYAVQGGIGPNGNLFPSKDAAVQALVDGHNLHQLGQAVGGTVTPPASTARLGYTNWANIPGRASTFSSRPGSVSFDVDLGGVSVGNIHRTGYSGGWTAFPPTGAAWGLQGTPGSGGNFPTKTHAARALALAHQAHQASLTTSPTAVMHPTRVVLAHTTTNGIRTYDVYAGPNVTNTSGGNHIGQVETDHGAFGGRGGWIAYANPTAPGGTGVSVPGGPFRSRGDAVMALNAYHTQRAHQAAQVASNTTLGPRTRRIDPAVKAAQDVLYGLDPKAKTTTRQLQAYGALRTAQFNSMDITEQTHMLGDLSYIATTSKGPNAKKAQDIIDRFTPPGTPAGTMPAPSTQVVGPANGTQTRLPSPQSGLLKQAANSGVRGDDWLSPTSGTGGRVWGRYGSGGLLIRHVDDQGVERYLMTQRGPYISDGGKWSYPGGAFESLEDFYQGSTREVAEELGWTDADFAGAEVHGYHVFERPDVDAVDGATGATKPWTYHSIAVDVPTQLVPNLQSHGATAETADAKWMTRAEIEDLDRRDMLHGPVAGGKLQQNVMSLFPAASRPTAARPGPQSTRQPRLTGTPKPPAAPPARHKPSKGKDLIPDQLTRDKLRQDVKKARRAYAGKSADDRLAAIGAMQGFDDVPVVVSKAEMDALLATGDYIEIWRGVKGIGGIGPSGPNRAGGAVSQTKTAHQINEEMRSGPAYYGIGQYGNGYYFTSVRRIARDTYSDGTHGSVARALIPKTAVTKNANDVETAAHSISTPQSQARGQSHEDGTLYDEGRYAAAIGLDAIEIPYGTWGSSHIAPSPGDVAFNVVNRSILILEEA